MENFKTSKRDDALPDLSGVFDIDESLISNETLVPPVEGSENTRRTPIMLSDPLAEKQMVAEHKQKRAQIKEKKRKKQKKQLHKKLTLAGLILLGLVCAVLGIKTGIEYRERPAAYIAKATTGSLEQHYDAKALLVNRIVGTGQMGTVAVFVENDYDIYGINKGLNVQILSQDAQALTTGKVQSISRCERNDELLGSVILALPDKDYDAAANYMVTVLLDANLSASEQNIVNVSIVTKSTQDAVLIPDEAVFRENAQYYVYTCKRLSKQIEKTQVSVGIAADGLIEITDGLKAKSLVAYVNGEEVTLQNGEKVREIKNDRRNTDE